MTGPAVSSAPTARRFADKRIALIGEAAHVIPPIGAQGLNLGLRDAATISELAILANRSCQDIGADDMLAHYDRLRRADVGSRALAVDLLNRTLLSDLLPAQGAGIRPLPVDCIGPLRRAVMRRRGSCRGPPRCVGKHSSRVSALLRQPVRETPD